MFLHTWKKQLLLFILERNICRGAQKIAAMCVLLKRIVAYVDIEIVDVLLFLEKNVLFCAQLFIFILHEKNKLLQ